MVTKTRSRNEYRRDWPRWDWTRRVLPDTKNADGRPVWEPPTFSYSHLVNEAYEKKRDAVLEYFDYDVSKTTSFMDASIETELHQIYEEWTIANANGAMQMGDTEREAFHDGLLSAINKDGRDIGDELDGFGLKLDRHGNGKYKVFEPGKLGREYEPYLRNFTAVVAERIPVKESKRASENISSTIVEKRVDEKAPQVSNLRSLPPDNTIGESLQPLLLSNINMRPQAPPPLAFLLHYEEVSDDLLSATCGNDGLD